MYHNYGQQHHLHSHHQQQMMMAQQHAAYGSPPSGGVMHGGGMMMMGAQQAGGMAGSPHHHQHGLSPASMGGHQGLVSGPSPLHSGAHSPASHGHHLSAQGSPTSAYHPHSGGGHPHGAGAVPASGGPPTPLPTVSKSSIIRDVWADNLEEEFKNIRELVVDYPFVAMDTEFPGVVAKPVGVFKNPHEFYYATLRYNVNLLKVIQLGFSLLNERGEVPEGCCTWQFNFRFNLAEDTFAQDSIELLKTGGINFDHFRDHGIEIARFSELLFSSGLVLNPEVRWLAFHAGYDFGYLMKGLLNRDLPDKEEDFTALFHQLFPSVFDIKFVLRNTDIMHSAGLDFLADSLSVRRLGTAHQAGSDSLLTGHSFFKLLRDRLGRQMPHYANGILYGLREDSNATNGAVAHNGSSGMTPSTPPNATPYTPGGSAAGQFPSTPLMNLAMHGGNRDAKVHHHGMMK